MRILFSRTGSDGNATVIQSDSGALICIDAGLPCKKVNSGCGYMLHKCKTLLATHYHFDHVGRIQEFVKVGMKLYCGEETALKAHYTGGYEPLIHGRQYDVDSFRFIPLEMVHSNSDGSDCECFGFLIQDTTNGDKMLHVTDSSYIPYKFPPLQYYSLEANFFESDDYSEDIEYIEKSVERRRFNSHLSVNSATSFLVKQDLSKCKEIRLLHMSHSMTQAERDNIVPFIQSKIGRSDIPIEI